MTNVLSFNKVKAGLDKIASLGTIEEEFEVYGMTVRIRTLTADEQQAVIHYIGDYMRRYDDDEDASMEALQSFVAVRKKEALSYAIMQVGDIDLRGVSFVETGEQTEEGVSVKVPKHVFVRELIGQLDYAAVDTIHRKYSDLLSFSEDKAAEKVRFRDPEEELEKVEARRRELLEELGREDELTPPDTSEPAPQQSEDVNLAENIRDRAFARVEADQEETLLEERRSEVPPTPSNSQEDDGETDEEEPYPDSIDVAGTKFVRLDDPDTPYTDEEQSLLEEQERLYKQKYGGEEPPEAKDAREAKERLQKRRGPRQPLNQTDAQVTQGTLPSEREASRPTKVRKQEIDPDSIPLAEGYSRDNAEPLSRRHTQPNPGIDEGALNPPAKGGDNLNFKG